MSTIEATLSGGSTAAGEASALGGHVEVHERVARKLAEQIAGEAVGVPADRLSVVTAAYRGGLGVRITGALPVPALDDDTAVRAAGPVVHTAEHIQTFVRDRLTRVLGEEVTRVDVVVSAASIAPRRRVR